MKTEDVDLLLEYINYYISHDQLSNEQKISVIKETIEIAERIKGKIK